MLVIKLYACNLGDEAALKLAPFRSLEHIDITSDPIGSRGIKQLLKLELPDLERFTVANSNATADCLKLVTKRPMNSLYKLGHNYQRNFNYHLQEKKILPLASFVERQLF
jgi:hypothetical protein